VNKLVNAHFDEMLRDGSMRDDAASASMSFVNKRSQHRIGKQLHLWIDRETIFEDNFDGIYVRPHKLAY